MNKLVKVTLQNPLDNTDTLDYWIKPNDTELAGDWIVALEEILSSKLSLQKQFCFLGWPDSNRTIEYLCDELNKAIETINQFDFTQHNLPDYVIEEWFSPDTVRFPATYPIETRTPGDSIRDDREALGLKCKHGIMNQLHNHFEVLEGTIENPSPYGQASTPEVRAAIGELNHLCHELESLILSQRKAVVAPDWVRPSQITTFDKRQRYKLTDEHRQGFLTNGYDRQFGYVYMHWTQIGKTLFEVFNDEGAPELTESVCEAITHLEYYSGEFDIEWARDVVRNKDCPWHDKLQLEFENWLLNNNLDPRDPKLSLGYLPIAQVDLERSFGTTDMKEVWKLMSNKLDIKKIEVIDEPINML